MEPDTVAQTLVRKAELPRNQKINIDFMHSQTW